MVTAPYSPLDAQHYSPTEARTRIPGVFGWKMLSALPSSDTSSLTWAPSMADAAGEELSNQTAITSLPDDNPTYHTLIEAIERIADFSELSDNWDSYGGVRLSPHARENAQVFVLFLFTENLLDAGDGIDILPVPTGGIQFEWTGYGGEIEIEIDQQGNFNSLIRHQDGHYETSFQEMPDHWSNLRDDIKRIIG